MNIFDIQQDLISVFSEIEENEGELTPELEEKLAITQENFRNKVEAYIGQIKQLNSDIDLIDQESKRLVNRKKIKKNSIDFLKKILAEAIYNFGDTSKTGTKFLDYGTGRVSVKETQAVELNPMNTQICNQFFSNLNAKINYKMIEGATSVDCKLITDEIKDDIKNEPNIDPSYLNYPIKNLDINDLCALDAQISFKVNLGDLLQGEGFDFLKRFLTYVNNFKVEDGTSKTVLKEDYNIDELHIAKINKNKTIIMR